MVVDTGMSRIGFMYQDGQDACAIDEIAELCQLKGLDPEGIFTHFAVADEGNDGRGYTLMQLDHFLKLIDRLAQRGITFRLRHCSNSAAVLDYSDAQLDMVRPGNHSLWVESFQRGQGTFRSASGNAAQIDCLHVENRRATDQYQLWTAIYDQTAHDRGDSPYWICGWVSAPSVSPCQCVGARPACKRLSVVSVWIN